MSSKYPYKFYRSNIGNLPYPIVPIKIQVNQSFEGFDFLVDTGADIATLPFWMIEALGLKKNKLKKTSLRGISSEETTAYQGTIRVKFLNQEFNLRCHFTDNNETPLLLGKTDIFNRFSILFDNKNNQLIVKPVEKRFEIFIPYFVLILILLSWIVFSLFFDKFQLVLLGIILILIGFFLIKD